MALEAPETDHRRWLTWITGTVVASACSAAAYVLQVVLGGRLPEWGHWFLLIGGTVFTATAVLIPGFAARRQTQERRRADDIAREAGRQAQVVVYGYLTPALDGLIRIADNANAADRGARQERIKQLIVDIAISTKPDTRACFFHHDPGPPRTLRFDGVWASRDSRRRAPRQVFAERDGGAGDRLFSMLDNPNHPIMFVENTDNELPGHPPTDYKTFISAAVAADRTIFGFLSVDAPNPGDLTKHDKDLVGLLAQILSAALAITKLDRRAYSTRWASAQEQGFLVAPGSVALLLIPRSMFVATAEQPSRKRPCAFPALTSL